MKIVKTQYFRQNVATLFIATYTFILNSCENHKTDNDAKAIRPLTNVDRELLIDSCINKMNIELIEILSKPSELKTYLALNDSEIKMMIDIPSKRLSTNKKDALLVKISNLISNETIIPITCNMDYKIKVHIGHLALISLHSIEPYPFAAALGGQWCTGDPISEKISLPYNLIRFDMKEEMERNYKRYLKSNTRKEWIAEHR